MSRLDWDRAKRDNQAAQWRPVDNATKRKPVNEKATQEPPTAPQMRYLRFLCQQAGIHYTAPRTKRDASSRIKNLKVQTKRR